MHAAGLSNNHGTRHELSMPSTIIAVETLPHLRRAEFEGRPLPGAASAGVESQTGVLRPSVAESRGHSWTPGGGPRVGEQLGGGRRHGYAQAHGYASHRRRHRGVVVAADARARRLAGREDRLPADDFEVVRGEIHDIMIA